MDKRFNKVRLQLASDKFSEFIKENVESAKESIQNFLVTQGVLNFFFAFSISYLLSMLRVMQISVFMMMINISPAPNAQFFGFRLAQIINLDLLEGEDIMGSFLDFQPE